MSAQPGQCTGTGPIRRTTRIPINAFWVDVDRPERRDHPGHTEGERTGQLGLGHLEAIHREPDCFHERASEHGPRSDPMVRAAYRRALLPSQQLRADLLQHPYALRLRWLQRSLGSPPTAKVYVDNLRVDFCSVESVEFQELDSALDNNPGPRGGLRIFPDKQTPGDSTDRSLLCVAARMNRPDCPITMRLLDVDDPSTDAQPIHPNADAGNDNDIRGNAALTGAPGCVQTPKSGPDGVAKARFAFRSFRATTSW